MRTQDEVAALAEAADVPMAGRCKALIDALWGGSVNRCALDVGVPQQTLNRIVTGVTPNPRASVLTALAAGCRARITVDWLMRGAQ